MIAAPVGSPCEGECDRVDLLAGDLAGSEVSRGQCRPSSSPADRWGPADPRARLSAPVCVRACTDPGGSSVFQPGFSEGIKETIYRFCLNALEIHKLKNIAPNLMKQISICFLFLDLQ